jgi:CRP-like cAMP-binding protein
LVNQALETKGMKVMDFLEIFDNSEDLVTFAAGENIIEEGQEGDCLYVLVEVEALITLKGRQLGKIDAGEIIGEMALIKSEKRSATVTAATDCRLALINKASFSALLKHVPDFSMHLLEVMADRLKSAYIHIEEK